MTSSNTYILEGVFTVFDQKTKNRPYYFEFEKYLRPLNRIVKIKNILNAFKTTNTTRED